MPNRITLIGASFLLLAGCAGVQSVQLSDTAAALHRASQSGNLDEVRGRPCPKGYRGAQCELAVEAVIAAALRRLAPDVVVLNEVWASDRCAAIKSPPTGHICHRYQARTPREQARRLLGADYAIACDALFRNDCIGVRGPKVSMAECAPGNLCLKGARGQWNTAQPTRLLATGFSPRNDMKATACLGVTGSCWASS